MICEFKWLDYWRTLIAATVWLINGNNSLDINGLKLKKMEIKNIVLILLENMLKICNFLRFVNRNLFDAVFISIHKN